MFIPISTANPLAQRPLDFMVRQQGMGWLGDAAAAWDVAGTTLLYTAQWSAGIGDLTVSTDNVIAALKNNLAAYGMTVIASSVTSGGPFNYGITVTILDNVGHDTQANAQSVPDALVRQAIGNNLRASSLIVSALPGQSAGQPGGTDITSWLEDNAMWIGLGALALVTLPALIRKL